jgi:hypothetical protein
MFSQFEFMDRFEQNGWARSHTVESMVPATSGSQSSRLWILIHCGIHANDILLVLGCVVIRSAILVLKGM